MSELLADQLGIDESTISPEKDIYQDLGADSLDEVGIVMAIEEEFDIEIDDEKAHSCKTVADFIALV